MNNEPITGWSLTSDRVGVYFPVPVRSDEGTGGYLTEAEAWEAAHKLNSPDSQSYRIEIRYDFTGTKSVAIEHAHRTAGQIGGEVTAIFDENWEEI